MEMSVHIDNQPFKVVYKQQGHKQWRLSWGRQHHTGAAY